MSIRQHQFPYNGSVAPVSSNGIIFREDFQAGRGGNWTTTPGVVPPLPGTQFPPSRFRKWAPGRAWPPGGTGFVDTTRRALVLQSALPQVGDVHDMSGYTALAGSWTVDAPQFLAILETRVGVLGMIQAVGAAAGQYAGVIMSTLNLQAAVDGPFVQLGIRLNDDGVDAVISKWSDHETLMEAYAHPLPTAADCYLRVQIFVDPEDGMIFGLPQFSLSGFGWVTFGDDLLTLEGETTSALIGCASTGVRDADTGTIVAAVEYVGLVGPQSATESGQYVASLQTPGGRNWPAGV